MSNYKKLIVQSNEIIKLNSCNQILNYDAQVMMPRAGAEYRGELTSMLTMETAKRMKKKSFLKLLDASLNDSSLTEDERINVNKIHESVKFNNRIPVKLQGKISKLTTKGNSEWERVKVDHVDDTRYINVLTDLVDAIKESISYANQGEFESAYDYLLDGYSKGISAKEISLLFNELKPFIDDTLSKLTPSTDPDFTADENKVMDFCQIVAHDIIGTSDQFKLAKSSHPFCDTLGKFDVRITTRIKPSNILDCIGSTVHESGHATYETGLDPYNFGYALGSAASIAAHEGISLFYEKHVGESDYYATKISDYFDYSLVDVLAYNRSVNPENLIRTESDEITYQRHIINRFTIENELFNGNLKVKDIPSRWNELYGKDLPPHLGYAVDVHWSNGLFGYFPSYTLGHLIAAQLKNSMGTSFYRDDNLRVDLTSIRCWLKNNYFIYGARYNTSDLIVKATGEPLNIDHWKKYITNKFLNKG